MWQLKLALGIGRCLPHTAMMAEKNPKRPRDLNQWARRRVDIATGQVEDREPTPEEQGKNRLAGQLGGKKGGPSRAKALTKEQRKEIATKAAKSRWKISADNE
jgi:hypothetical protein